MEQHEDGRAQPATPGLGPFAPLVFTPRRFEGCQVLAVSGEIDLGNVHRFEVAVAEALRTGVPLVLDLSEVAFLDSLGLRALLLVRRTAAERDVPWTLVASDMVAAILALVGSEHALPLQPGLAEAVNALRRTRRSGPTPPPGQTLPVA